MLPPVRTSEDVFCASGDGRGRILEEHTVKHVTIYLLSFPISTTKSPPRTSCHAAKATHAETEHEQVAWAASNYVIARSNPCTVGTWAWAGTRKARTTPLMLSFPTVNYATWTFVQARGEKATIEKLTATLKTHAVDEDVSFT